MSALVVEPIAILDGATGLGRDVLGGKAWSIERMMALGIPVPPAFVLTTDVCRRYHDNGMALPDDVWAGIPDAMARIERVTGRMFGDPARPLLVSVRSGASTSMPGMMDTVLNLGINHAVERSIAVQSGNAAYAADTRRRFIEQFTKVVGCRPPDSPWEQLRLAVLAVLESWNCRRAVSYRESRGIPHDGGTAVTIQAMVFGNLDDESGTGVLFSRNPLSGAPEPYGEWLSKGQGEDVVSGRADAEPLEALAESMPMVHAELMAATTRLETVGLDVQDIEFTVEGGRLWLLQSRTAKRSPEASVRHAVQLQREGLIGIGEALDRIGADHVEAMLAPHLSSEAFGPTLAEGKPACPGIATGLVVIDPDEAEDRADRGELVILARQTTDPDDVAAMSVAAAVITELGGSTSHAAVVCREMAVPCIVGCGLDTVTALVGQVITVDATTGKVYAGALEAVASSPTEDTDLVTIGEWLRAETGAEPTTSIPVMLRQRSKTQEVIA